MKTSLRYFTLLILVVGAVGCSTPATQVVPTRVPATPDRRSATVLDMAERFNAGDLDGALTYWAEDARVYFYGLPPSGTEIYTGKQQIRPVFEENVAGHFKWEIEILAVSGDVVTARAKTWHDFTRQLGVAPVEAAEVYVIRDGKIAAYTWTITEESLARLKPALAKAMPPSPTSAPVLETPVTEMVVTFAGGTCTYPGPLTLKAGEIQVTGEVKDQDRAAYGLTFFTLDPDKDFVDLMAATVRDTPPPWSNMIFIRELGPGKSVTYRFPVKEGTIYLVCWSKPPDLPIGAAGPLVVKP